MFRQIPQLPRAMYAHPMVVVAHALAFFKTGRFVTTTPEHCADREDLAIQENLPILAFLFRPR
jgi:hypothetical protein